MFCFKADLQLCFFLSISVWGLELMFCKEFISLFTELCLEKLVVKSADVPMTLDNFVTVLKWAPKLRHLQVTGFRHAKQLLQTLSGAPTVFIQTHIYKDHFLYSKQTCSSWYFDKNRS